MLQILIDSAADTAPDTWEATSLIPMKVTIDGREYRDGVDLTASVFYDLLTACEEFPKTSQPSPQDFAERFEAVRKAGDELLYISLSSALSGTYQSAVIAREMVGDEGIHLVDSRTASHGIRLLAQRAVALRARGLSGGAIAQELDRLKGRVRIFAVVDTLEYLYRGGRLSRTAAVVGGVANVKPIVTVDAEGKVQMAAKALGRMKALAQLQTLVADHIPDPAYPLYSLYTCGLEGCEQLEKKLFPHHPVEQRLQVGPTIGAHVGPGACGVLYVEKENEE